MVLFLAAEQGTAGAFLFEIHGLIRKRHLAAYVTELAASHSEEIGLVKTLGFDSHRYDPALLYLCQKDHQEVAVLLYEQLTGGPGSSYVAQLVRRDQEDRAYGYSSFWGSVRSVLLLIVLFGSFIWFGLKLYDIRMIYGHAASLNDYGLFSKLLYRLFAAQIAGAASTAASIQLTLLFVLVTKGLQLVLSAVALFADSKKIRLFKMKEIDLEVLYVLAAIVEFLLIWHYLPIDGFWAWIKVFLFFELLTIVLYNMVIDEI